MRTTIFIDDDLLKEVKALSNAKTKREAVKKALEEFVKRRRYKRLFELEGKVDLSLTLKELLERRRRDVPYR